MNFVANLKRIVSGRVTVVAEWLRCMTAIWEVVVSNWAPSVRTQKNSKLHLSLKQQ